ncbi:DNA topoisomerase 3-alpha [Bienertia sinuspersici]
MAGNRQFSGCSSSSSNSRGVNQSKVKCQCGGDAIWRTIKNGPNARLKFYGCPLWPVSLILI